MKTRFAAILAAESIIGATAVIFFVPNDVINATDEDGKTLLHYAAEQGREDFCMLLIPEMTAEACSIISPISDYATSTALHYAIKNKMEGACKLLIPKMSSEACSAVNWSSGDAALEDATKNNMEEVCKLLIEKMTSEDCEDAITMNNVVLINASENNMAEVHKQLLQKVGFEKYRTHVKKVLGDCEKYLREARSKEDSITIDEVRKYEKVVLYLNNLPIQQRSEETGLYIKFMMLMGTSGYSFQVEQKASGEEKPLQLDNCPTETEETALAGAFGEEVE